MEKVNHDFDSHSRSAHLFAGFAAAAAFLLAIQRHIGRLVYVVRPEQWLTGMNAAGWYAEWIEAVVICSMAIALIFLGLLIWRFPRTGRRQLLISCVPLLSILLLAAFSLQWSWHDQATHKAVWFLLAMSLSVAYLGLNYEIEQVLRLFTVACAVLIVANLVVLLVLPERAIMVGKFAGAWRGLFRHKNGLGEAAALMNLIFLVNLADFKNQSWGPRFYHGLFYVLTIFLVFKSDSATAVVLLAVNLGVLLFSLLLMRWGGRLRPIHWIGISLAGLASLAVAWQARHFIVEGLLGRTPTLTGRIPLWLHLVPFIERRLLLGYGFGTAFWSHPEHIKIIHNLVGWSPGTAHNGFVDITLSLGLVGLLLCAVFSLQILILSIRLVLQSRTVISALPLLLLSYALTANVTESSLVMGDRFTWLALIAAWAMCVRAIHIRPPEGETEREEPDPGQIELRG